MNLLTRTALMVCIAYSEHTEKCRNIGLTMTESDQLDGLNVASFAHDVAQKLAALQHLLQSEVAYTKDLTSFVEMLYTRVYPWLSDRSQQTYQRDKQLLIFSKKADLDTTHKIWQDMALVHRTFSNNLNQRYALQSAN